MEIRLKIPKQSVSSRECIIVEWLISAGDQVKTGQPLYIIESEKATLEIESPVDGLIKQLAETGQTYKVGEEIATIEMTERKSVSL